MFDRTSQFHPFAVPALIGRSAASRELCEQIAWAARTSAKVLIVGETGTGKEIVARLIHSESPRRTGPFVAVNCGGIPDTLLESELFGHTRGSFTGADRDTGGLVRQANGGTLFLDELGEMSLRMQVVLLRFTETGEVQAVGAERVGRADVRTIAATNRDLRARIADGAFREDLYYRLNVVQIHVPPLRERTDDVLPLMEHYLQHAAVLHRLPVPALTADAAQLLVAYPWPGNVRELRNVAERLVLRHFSGPVTPGDLPPEVCGDSPVSRAAPRGAAGPEAAATVPIATDRVEYLWSRLAAGHDFWSVVYAAFKTRELTRAELAALVDRGLQETRGSYTALLRLFNLPRSDYKRFHGFLYQQKCNLAVAPYRRPGSSGIRRADRSRRDVA